MVPTGLTVEVVSDSVEVRPELVAELVPVVPVVVGRFACAAVWPLPASRSVGVGAPMTSCMTSWNPSGRAPE